MVNKILDGSYAIPDDLVPSALPHYFRIIVVGYGYLFDAYAMPFRNLSRCWLMVANVSIVEPKTCINQNNMMDGAIIQEQWGTIVDRPGVMKSCLARKPSPTGWFVGEGRQILHTDRLDF